MRRIIGSARANPLPHAGTISVFLLGVVTFTGLYITLFFEFGFDASYSAVEDLTNHPIQRVMRGIHRYSSAALVLTTIVHAWRIFVSGRFGSARRYRWLTGLTALVLIWLAGVTGYWLVWDLRAQALGESVQSVIGGFGWGASFVVRNIVGSGAGSGSGLMVFVWFAHVILTIVIGFFMWRHLRRSRLRWVPPRHWMILMAAGLLLLAIAVPADLLDHADPARLTPAMPLDPFILFLLPPLLSSKAGLVVLAMTAAVVAAALVPWVLKDRSPVVEVLEDKCTGCDLCVADCPYMALSMVQIGDTEGTRGLAVVDPDACVGCGICLGSCSFGALELPGFDSQAAELVDPQGKQVVVTCERHLRTNRVPSDDQHTVVAVRCTGMFHAQAVGDLMRRGAESVQIVGCAPGECAYGIGNELTHDRLGGQRAPHLQRAFQGSVAEDYVALGDLALAVKSPGLHPATDATHMPAGRRTRVAAAAVVMLSLLGVGLATLIPFDGASADAAVRVVVDHTPGRQITGQPSPSGVVGQPVAVVVTVDGVAMESKSVPRSGNSSVGVVDFDLDPGSYDLVVELHEGDTVTTLFSGPAVVEAGRRVFLEAIDEPPPPGADEGRAIFNDNRRGGCSACHSVAPGDD
ncbi:MAG: cytochrome b N-terminal domain-containing protein, partial [Acidimicrobiales bacterium]|nr:cytochrome b N-terminal domain-containing protein [Acidimicrobiales bacterium]